MEYVELDLTVLAGSGEELRRTSDGFVVVMWRIVSVDVRQDGRCVSWAVFETCAWGRRESVSW
jgi:hypothetical protein